MCAQRSHISGLIPVCKQIALARYNQAMNGTTTLPYLRSCDSAVGSFNITFGLHEFPSAMLLAKYTRTPAITSRRTFRPLAGEISPGRLRRRSAPSIGAEFAPMRRHAGAAFLRRDTAGAGLDTTHRGRGPKGTMTEGGCSSSIFSRICFLLPCGF